MAVVAGGAVSALERSSDPDGCFSCHGLPGLEYVDQDGVRRVATILQQDYYASLHGSVPCTDCHRKIRDYPHDPKDGYVDCGESCHVQEPSEGKAFSHKEVVDEFKRSAHGEGEKAGATQGFHGGNRLSELEEEQNPSCRRCHYNEPYIKPGQMARFQEHFAHVDGECGSCHQGVVWRTQYSGHILRRLVGKHYSKQDANAMCISCHGDHQRMVQAKIQDPETKEWSTPGVRFLFAVDSYAKTLHGRLLEVGIERGASCLDCHAPAQEKHFRHDVRRHRDSEAATHTDHLAETCGQESCHGSYARDPRNRKFVFTDMHSVDWVDRLSLLALLGQVGFDLSSGWGTALLVLGPLAGILILGQGVFWLWERGSDFALLGGRWFQERMLGKAPRPRLWQKLWLQAEAVEVPKDDAKATLDDSLTILYGSQTGNSEGVAHALADLAQRWQLPVTLVNMADFPPKALAKHGFLFIVTSTHGEGEPPLNAQALHSYLKELADRPHAAPLLRHLRYGVLGLGDSSYRYFCQCGKDFDRFLEVLGAEKVLPRVDADVDFEVAAKKWMQEVVQVYRRLSGYEGVEPPPEANASVQIGYDRNRPYLAQVLVNRNLNGPGSSKETRHIEIGLEDSGLTYEPGDALGVYPRNSATYVETLLTILGWSGHEEILLEGEVLSLREALLGRLDVTGLTRPVVEKYAACFAPQVKALLAEEQAFQEYAWGRQWIDLLSEYPPSQMTPQGFVDILRRLPPRLYSISSSLKKHPGEVHLTVGVVRYRSHGREREGVCSNFLARRAVGQKVPIFVQSNPYFRPPSDPNAAMIMVGPGTGIAPFRAFLQEREAIGASGRNWLFFGEQHARCDFLYAQEWQAKLQRGILTHLDLAFSRDQPERIYVQHKMKEKAKELYAWLADGAYFYVCGDASRMAKDVRRALIEICIDQGGMTEDQALEFLKTLEQTGRYAQDVY